MADETTAPASTAQPTSTPQITLYWYGPPPPGPFPSYPPPQLTPPRLEQSRSQRILWLLTELSLPYKLTVFHRDPKTHFAPPELKAIHPLGKSPVIAIKPPGGGPDVVLAESGLITEYLTEHFGAGTTLAPTRWQEGKEGQVGGETEAWMRYKYLLHYCEGSLMPLLNVLLVSMSMLLPPSAELIGERMPG